MFTRGYKETCWEDIALQCMDQFILRGTKQGKQRGNKKQQGRGECLHSGKWGGIIPQTTYTFSTQILQIHISFSDCTWWYTARYTQTDFLFRYSERYIMLMMMMMMMITIMIMTRTMILMTTTATTILPKSLHDLLELYPRKGTNVKDSWKGMALVADSCVCKTSRGHWWQNGGASPVSTLFSTDNVPSIKIPLESHLHTISII